LANLGNFIIKKQPDFDPRNFGFPKLLPLIKNIGKFEIDERDTGVGNIRHIYLKQRIITEQLNAKTNSLHVKKQHPKKNRKRE
ncbi:MAG: OST-HTH/LOTUS domain-containing protein, partial [Bacteroidia bacterium]|nr:OST-HTH/LOTUS domain-containing protein [Bacteroidia bacterium]